MKNILKFIFFVSLVLSLNSCKEKRETSKIHKFSNFLGKEKSEALEEAIGSFDLFLELNYPYEKTNRNRIELFLNELTTNLNIDTSYVFDTKKNATVIEKFENSGLRKEIWLYTKEEKDYRQKNNIHEFFIPITAQFYSEPVLDTINLIELLEDEKNMIPLDSIEYSLKEAKIELEQKDRLFINPYGDYLYGLAKYSDLNSFVYKYVKSKFHHGDFSTVLTIESLLEQNIALDNPFIKRIITLEMYYPIMEWDVKKSINYK